MAKVKTSAKDKAVKAKRTGYRFKTEGIDALQKKDGTLNKKGKKLQYKKPTKEEIEKYKKRDNEYPNDVKQIYHEKRDDRKHSDDNLKKKFEDGGAAVAVVEISCDEMKSALGREPKYPYDFIDGKKYTKCFLRPFYRCEE